jgi:hypothetical protein
MFIYTFLVYVFGNGVLMYNLCLFVGLEQNNSTQSQYFISHVQF